MEYVWFMKFWINYVWMFKSWSFFVIKKKLLFVQKKNSKPMGTHEYLNTRGTRIMGTYEGTGIIFI